MRGARVSLFPWLSHITDGMISCPSLGEFDRYAECVIGR
jgi:hypothetical protein